MNGFWDFLIRPALEAAEARVVVEVGSEGGRHTRRLLDWCAARRARLHVVDPEPLYDVAELEAAHGERLVFHRAPSLEVLNRLGSMDAVLIDGDHNWFTVYSELKMLEATQRRHFPLVVLHDVAWPFARRDMYYAPARIPARYRRPYAQGGLRRGAAAFVEGDGLAPELYKAIEEGGPCNGVLTAVEDFLQETRLGLRFEVVPVDFGLGLIASELLQENRPALRSLLDSLRSPGFGERLLAYAEERRIEDLTGLQGETRRTREELVRVTADLGRHQAELARHEVEVKRLRDELAALQRVRDEVAALQRQLHVERQEGESVRRELNAARDALAHILDSRSWRFTAPLRRAGNVVRSWERA